MNAVYLLGPRLFEAKRWGKETLTGGGLDNHQFNDYLTDGPLPPLFEKPDTVWTPRVLKDGSDSVGALGALNRVYLNIGTFSEEWLTHFNALVGGKPISPITIEVSRKNSAYFKATEAQTLDMARFFLKTTSAHHLADAPGGKAYQTTDEKVLTRGKVAFAENCARCHSSKLPPAAPGLDPAGCAGKDYLGCWNSYWAWTQTAEFKQKMRDIVAAPDFLEDNYLSAEFRVPVTLLQTNACSPLATNAIRGNIWDNFSSESYKELPSVGQITWYQPFTGEPRTYDDAGRRSRLHAAALARQPLVDGAVPAEQHDGPLRGEPVGRRADAIVRRFDPQDAVAPGSRQGLAARRQDSRRHRPRRRSPAARPCATSGSISRSARGTCRSSWTTTLTAQRALFPSLFSDDGIQIGPIPPGTPIGLLSNLKLLDEDPDPVKQAQHAAKGRRACREDPPTAAQSGRECHQRRGASGVRGPRRADARSEQVSRPGREPGSSLRDRAVQRRQGGTYSVPEDVLICKLSHEALDFRFLFAYRPPCSKDPLNDGRRTIWTKKRCF